ncbi:hypothetical protein Pint_33181 [Pistacia integerrima]|uniref:Uncharacterized protein n=1 Tax=Pistacia integerrima TaxID=434235 RepID=A0ACC0X6U3_9ROSI|nr:hypothetical protein Pint_33181 [Pistacia integerrima]
MCFISLMLQKFSSWFCNLLVVEDHFVLVTSKFYMNENLTNHNLV